MNQGPPGKPSDVYGRYHLDRHTEARTGRELQERVDREHEVQYGPFGPYIGELINPGRVDDLLDRQAAQLKDGVLTRSAPDQPAVYYQAIPHQDLYDGVHHGVDPGQVGDMGTVWTDLGNKLATFNQAIATAIGNSEADWVGRAGDGARQALADMGNRAGETGVSAQLAGTLFTQQSRALTDAKNTVPPPPAVPFDVRAANDRLMSITDPILLTQQAAADRAAFEQQQKDHREAARVVETYDRTVAQTAAAQPAFAPAPVAPAQRVEPDPVTPPGSGDPSGRKSAPVPAVGGTTETSTTTAPPGGHKAEVGPTGGNTGGTTQTSGTGVGQVGGHAPSPGTGNGPGGPLPTAVPASGRAGLGLPASRVGGGKAGGGRSGGIPGGAAAAKGFRGGVPGPGVPGGGAGSGVPGGGAGTGALPGAGSTTGGTGRGGPAGATTGAGRGAPGGPGGIPGMAGVGPGGARGEEDIEHQTPSYLVEADPDEVFGANETTAPPVIGDWSQ
ncbi:hypothetical protein ACQPZF_36665 [Actinosynnema sp. CS-041913]|uniref:hypothetical protein n=1 Tax=Actinosynnema sp. CS-041913 TaxID=3239917 RepID=UPI003D94F372